jgi:hypothetical protein
MKRIWIGALAFALFVPWILARANETSRTLTFEHVPHVVDMELGCDACHAEAESSVRGTDDLLPGKDVCADCHDVDDEEECGLCHVDADDPQGYAERHVLVDKFPHASHVTAGMTCSNCHGDPAGDPVMPAKSQCRSCHVTASNYSDCGVCHIEGEHLVPSSHTPGWESLHGIEAGWESGSCLNCHAQVDCQDCHAGDNVRPRSHPLNYAFNHALEARSKEVLCANCHLDQSFCADCHVAEQVLPYNHSRADWLLPTGGRHAEEAMFDMENCIACHDAGAGSPSCAQCHGE